MAQENKKDQLGDHERENANQSEEPRSEGGKNKGNPPNENHDEGQYQEGETKPTMSPGSSEAEVNPSAKNHNQEREGQ